MYKVNNKKHYIDSLFLMLLFLIFTISAVSVLLMAIGSYRSVVDCSERNSNARVLCGYIREKVRQNNTADVISVESINGVDCIVIDQLDGSNLYIYENEGQLCEQYVNSDATLEMEFGEKLAAISDYDVLFKDSILKVHIADDFGNDEIIKIGVLPGVKPQNQEVLYED